jgi:hypothetical protein
MLFSKAICSGVGAFSPAASGRVCAYRTGTASPRHQHAAWNHEACEMLHRTTSQGETYAEGAVYLPLPATGENPVRLSVLHDSPQETAMRRRAPSPAASPHPRPGRLAPAPARAVVGDGAGLPAGRPRAVGHADRSVTAESYVAVRADSEGRLFVGGREHCSSSNQTARATGRSAAVPLPARFVDLRRRDSRRRPVRPDRQRLYLLPGGRPVRGAGSRSLVWESRSTCTSASTAWRGARRATCTSTPATRC